MKLLYPRAVRPVSLALCVCVAAALSACGGGSGAAAGDALQSMAQDSSTPGSSAVDTSISAPTTSADNTLAQDTVLAGDGGTTAQATGSAGEQGGVVASTTTDVVPSGAGGSGSLTVSWIAPQTNADGSTLNDLSGYRIFLGTTSGNYSRIIAVDNPYAVNFTVDNLPAGTYYAVVKAVDSSNNESGPSAEVVATVQ